MIYKKLLIINLIFLIFLLRNTFGARYDEDADIELENLEVKNCIDEIKITLTMLTKQSFEQFEFDIEQLLDLVEAINELGVEGVNLAKLMLDDSSNCARLVGEVEVSINDTNTESGLVIGPVDFNIEYTGEAFRVQELQQAMQAMTDSNEKSKEMIITLLTTNNERVAKDIKRIVKQKSVQERIADLEGSTKLSEEAMQKYIQDVTITLNQMETKLNQQIEKREDLRREAKMIRDNYNYTTLLSREIIEGGEFSCQVDFDMDNKKMITYYNYTDIAENIAILRGIEKEIIERLTNSEALSPPLIKQVKEVQETIKQKIDFLIELNERLYNQQNQLLRAYIEALEEKRLDKAFEYLKILKVLHNVEIATKKIYSSSRKNYYFTLKQCMGFDDFSSRVGCINYLSSKLAKQTEYNLEILILYQYEHGVRLQYNGKSFNSEAALYVAYIYMSNPKIALRILQRFYEYIQNLVFIMRVRKKWQEELLLFLKSNMRLIIKESCDEKLFDPMKIASETQTDKYFRFSIVAIEVLLAKLKEKDMDLFTMLMDLKNLLYAYWKNPKHLAEIQLCKDLKRTLSEQVQ